MNSLVQSFRSPWPQIAFPALPPPVRDETATITPQSLRSEARAIAALAQCGGYPMAANRQDVEVHFPRPE